MSRRILAAVVAAAELAAASIARVEHAAVRLFTIYRKLRVRLGR